VAKPRRRRSKATPGPKPSITLLVVKRVSRRFGQGLTLELALAAEGNSKVNLETWKKAMQAHPEFSPHWAAARGKFLEGSVQRLIASKDLANLRWLLARRFPDLFAESSGSEVHVTQNASVTIPEDVLKAARELAASGETVPIKSK
jgi:hypothetical protein